MKYFLSIFIFLKFRLPANRNRAFIALVLVVLVSAFLLAAVLENTNSAAVLFDEVNRAQYRFSATQASLVCLDHAMLELTHDYFFEATSSSSAESSLLSPLFLFPVSRCSIVSVGETAGSVIGSGYKTITVAGMSSNVTATIIAQVLLSDRKISLLSEKTFF